MVDLATCHSFFDFHETEHEVLFWLTINNVSILTATITNIIKVGVRVHDFCAGDVDCLQLILDIAASHFLDLMAETWKLILE